MATSPLTYAEAGVDIEAADRVTENIGRLARRTFDSNVLAGVGSFGATYSLAGQRLRDPVLVSSADGVGTKLKVAFLAGRHDSVGQCLVNHCVNDIAVQGATPLFFLDYFATGRLEPGVAAAVVRGLSDACIQNRISLIGGETAEMPGMYRDGEYDLAGFIVGAAERNGLLLGDGVRAGSSLVGLPSSGLHTNGYSLARKIFFDIAGWTVETRPGRLGCTVGEELLKVHRSYLKALRTLKDSSLLLGAAHITGGGLPGNVPRVLPNGLQAKIWTNRWTAPPVFRLLSEIGSVESEEMYRTFNMGIGLVACVTPGAALAAIRALADVGEKAIDIGVVETGTKGVVLEP
ncbi:MAG: phosphoribosylformylglycinamidine cyclo-ligase [Bryobacterales bacterium]|nr:phosphoribosylformylglycinamidine cyclo-ligase [Bryobacterales bacterium]